ncbi:hypothetical protein [Burkholderia ubonensis]|nr:hypothetical protein [Burkholderia ubonensis]
MAAIKRSFSDVKAQIEALQIEADALRAAEIEARARRRAHQGYRITV